MGELWILGATGRTGRAIAGKLHAQGHRLVLVGRNRKALEEVRASLGSEPRLKVGRLDEILASLPDEHPAVVVNTVGPFVTTAPQVAHACPPGTHYLDLSNEFLSILDILRLRQQAEQRGQTLVAGSGFGVTAVDALVRHLCHGRPPAQQVRADAVPSVAVEAGELGTALASSIVTGLPAGGWRVADGRIRPFGIGAAPARLTTPDGESVTTVSFPSGDLLAAWRGSRAQNVIAASSELPSSPAVPPVTALASVLLRVPALSRLAISRLAQVRTAAKERPRQHSWARVRVDWADGTVREGWLCAGEDGMTVTCDLAAEVAARLARGEGKSGAFTPAELFGPEIARAVGGTFVEVN